MNTSITLSMDLRRAQKTGIYPIILRLTHFRKTTAISTGQSIPAEFWDETKRKVKKSYTGIKSVSNLNNFLNKELGNAQEIINRLHEKGQLNYLSIKEVRQKIVGKNKYHSFFKFGKDHEKDLRSVRRIGTADSYKDLLSRLKTFTNDKDLKFNEVNYDFLKKFERFHMSRDGNSLNGLASYLRTLRAIYNKGIKEGLIDKEAYPFSDYKIKTTPTLKRAIDAKYIKKILELELEEGSWPFHYRNYFLLSYMLFGMSFIDLAFLKRKNIVNERIQFQRKKTSKEHDIKITEQLHELLRYYLKGKDKDDFILPILTSSSLEEQYKQIKGARKRYNIGLGKIAKRCGIENHMTSYVSRHSFATHAMLKKVPLQVISAMLGHNKLSTTQIYLKSLPSVVLDTYQEELNSI
ncbi:MAG: site-specific integrase [Eudoraea sp.]|uniref:phage integrase SAM-like domain-containing protein n=1 Tax=Eudoraea sp. TaxID=1979955 RepID=UPI003C70AF69